MLISHYKKDLDNAEGLTGQELMNGIRNIINRGIRWDEVQ